MSTDRVYKQAIKRVFGKKYHDERMAEYWGRDDDAIHVIASLRHCVHKIASERMRTHLNSLIALMIALLSR